MNMCRLFPPLPFGLLLAGIAAVAAAVENLPENPSSKEQPAERPSITVKRLGEQPAPSLKVDGADAKKAVALFIDWASSANRQQDDIVRRTISEARDNQDVMAALCEAAFDAQEQDFSRALVSVALLGEARSKHGEECLMKFANQPLPEKGTVVEGEILERVSLEKLQAKAVAGLAYLGTEQANLNVLEIVAKHPSRIVRAEAISAYFWNQKESKVAYANLKKVVRSEERIFLDRITRKAGEQKESFNRKLAYYLKMHPELVPPKPPKSKQTRKSTLGTPPEF